MDLGVRNGNKSRIFLGYERLQDWNINGWEQDTWHYYKKEGHPSLTLYYCGYDGEITLSLK